MAATGVEVLIDAATRGNNSLDGVAFDYPESSAPSDSDVAGRRVVARRDAPPVTYSVAPGTYSVAPGMHGVDAVCSDMMSHINGMFRAACPRRMSVARSSPVSEATVLPVGAITGAGSREHSMGGGRPSLGGGVPLETLEEEPIRRLTNSNIMPLAIGPLTHPPTPPEDGVVPPACMVPVRGVRWAMDRVGSPSPRSLDSMHLPSDDEDETAAPDTSNDQQPSLESPEAEPNLFIPGIRQSIGISILEEDSLEALGDPLEALHRPSLNNARIHEEGAYVDTFEMESPETTQSVETPLDELSRVGDPLEDLDVFDSDVLEALDADGFSEDWEHDDSIYDQYNGLLNRSQTPGRAVMEFSFEEFSQAPAQVSVHPPRGQCGRVLRPSAERASRIPRWKWISNQNLWVAFGIF